MNERLNCAKRDRKSEGVKKRGSSGHGRGGDRNERVGEAGRRDVDEVAKTTPRARVGRPLACDTVI